MAVKRKRVAATNPTVNVPPDLAWGGPPERDGRPSDDGRGARVTARADRQRQRADEKAQRKQAALDAAAQRKQAAADAKLERFAARQAIRAGILPTVDVEPPQRGGGTDYGTMPAGDWTGLADAGGGSANSGAYGTGADPFFAGGVELPPAGDAEAAAATGRRVKTFVQRNRKTLVWCTVAGVVVVGGYLYYRSVTAPIRRTYRYAKGVVGAAKGFRDAVRG